MNVIKTAIPNVLIFEPKVFGDDRGFFFESFNHRIFEEAVGRKVSFVQDNHSKSRKGVLRGLHFQKGDHAQGKLVRCTLGEVFDVAVDIRTSSPTFGKWVGVHLSAENKSNCGFLKVLHMVSSLLAKLRSSFIKRLIIMRHLLKAVYCGVMTQLVSNGR